MTTVVELREAVVLLGRFPALSGADLDVDEGEIVLLHGPNGAGKTTLLRTLAGLHRLDAGRGTVLGVDLGSARRALRGAIGLLGHRTHLYDDLTVLDNARFWAAAAGVAEADARRAMERVGVEPRLADVAVERLSAGQRRRVALAILVARRPRLWLLDEPHAGLDDTGRDLLDELLGEAVAAGATVVLSSHELDRASTLATRSVLVSGGTATSSTLGSDDAA
ncbi:MAG: heme ABC exporter ATP-binding protein CcmA [Actinomycetota bacterium]